ncbi:MAG TPA: VOC family protein [Rhizomicrobium sp.]|jgi:catechol 2,3-dioxygenase-like lactoylglutathione lyase family enzyme|nr:VOC family protein [Rhizomicrobium sp.]
MSLDIIGVDHVQIAVPRALEADCLAFYRTVVALEEIPKPEALRGRGGAWFRAGALQVHIGVDADASPASKRHVCFLVRDLAEAKASIEARGVPIEGEGVAEGLKRFFIRDPAGNRLEIGQR